MGLTQPVTLGIRNQSYQFINVDIREDTGHRNMRKQFDGLVSRKHLVSRQDILNVKHQIQDQSIIRHSDDATSVQLAVNALQQEEFNLILYFKAQHIDDEDYPQLSRDTFVLILQTEFQRQIYHQFSSKIVCIDSTHGTNSYKFKLITLLVSDDFAAALLFNNYTLHVVIFGQGLRHLLCRWHLDKYVNCDVPYHYYVREGKCPPLKYTP